MYRLEWIDLLKARQRQPREAGRASNISPVVWSLGLTSMLTDISSEMVNSVLPVYLVLHLRLSPLQYGVIDGLYNGFAVLLVGLLAGWLADRAHRQKEVAAAGYGLSAACKLLLLTAAGAWSGILLAVGLDRVGKGIRTAPRDALISLSTPATYLATAFGVHRAMDAAGALIGPLVAFLLLARLPAAYDVLWIVSFIFGCLGVAALWLLVPSAKTSPTESQSVLPSPPRLRASWLSDRRFLALAAAASLLALATISDGFIYLLLQRKGSTSTGLVPLFYVMTAGAYMLFAVPVGRLADRIGRIPVLISGYLVLLLLYAVVLYAPSGQTSVLVGCLALLGLYYAATEGVLVTLASAVLPPERRTLGIALLGTGIGASKLVSSVAFGWLWQAQDERISVVVFAAALFLFSASAVILLRRSGIE
jgi:MFS family permease